VISWRYPFQGKVMQDKHQPCLLHGLFRSSGDTLKIFSARRALRRDKSK
jgi:hypothetical protein